MCRKKSEKERPPIAAKSARRELSTSGVLVTTASLGRTRSKRVSRSQRHRREDFASFPAGVERPSNQFVFEEPPTWCSQHSAARRRRAPYRRCFLLRGRFRRPRQWACRC